jgi:hypothetical protein|nr:abortive infection system antitoxin AbiGi family protein [uncultured Flavobacterium sp.]
MSNISSNTIFHFSNSAENIFGILKNGFLPKFCLEEFGSDAFNPGKSTPDEAIPMTCFCDIPLSQMKSHLEFYGSYGIGLSKEWAKKKGLTPVTYIHKDSTQLKYLRHLNEVIFHLTKNVKFEDWTMDENPMFALIELSAFFKSYEGKMWRNNKYIKKKFYDEREWRYVPFINDNELEYRLSKEEFLDNIKRATANQLIQEEFGLKFLATDIKYLIVKTEKEIISLSDSLDRISGIFEKDEIKILKTKIISAEQIVHDF